jgi:cysteine sulfinate desulfinase/cysteine desulfurase-like protein
MPTLKITKKGIVEKTDRIEKRYPNLNTVLMVEDFLKENSDIPIKISELKRKLPKQIMHQTLNVILEYLFRSGKIIYGPRGVQWIYVEPEHLKKMLEGGMEI